MPIIATQTDCVIDVIDALKEVETPPMFDVIEKLNKEFDVAQTQIVELEKVNVKNNKKIVEMEARLFHIECAIGNWTNFHRWSKPLKGSTNPFRLGVFDELLEPGGVLCDRYGSAGDVDDEVLEWLFSDDG